MSHPLDRPVWNALTTRQRDVAIGDARAIRVAPAIGLFAAMAEDSDACREALARLIPDDGPLGLLERETPLLPADVRVVKTARCVQMVADRIATPRPDCDVIELGDADAAEMLALATLTEPGPFAEETHRLGSFIGIRQGGTLVAMAGERMRPPGFTEVSGVCTRPGFRGRGFAATLMTIVAHRIVARGEQPFLHAYADQPATIARYERLGFRTRATIDYTLIARG